ncbi:hypothetical protein PHSY_000467 [Pseudozyma hubeiensis SY62]|uniref:Uncharacterized protein n=1 Tax=Pseudozyma hubeiensis (strain SY62) TaxID=1305764 RepID=R9NWE4_PSEHS|nr:hypothetical protein PHSY_000467 [Pseudozyma hubeiensis SY62]GAC92908.1 hypothetical protein PHSY_000467 [Pseudozyma hubeiensis SY62]
MIPAELVPTESRSLEQFSSRYIVLLSPERNLMIPHHLSLGCSGVFRFDVCQVFRRVVFGINRGLMARGVQYDCVL